MITVLVTGGRYFSATTLAGGVPNPKCEDQKKLILDTLDKIHMERKIGKLIQGGARGADTTAYCWAVAKKVRPVTIYARWEDIITPPVLIKTRPNGAQYNALAGANRNQKMVEEKPDLVVAFPGNRGTADMVERARKAGIEVIEIQNQQMELPI